MWRTVIVTQGEKLTIKDGWLVVYSDTGRRTAQFREVT